MQSKYIEFYDIGKARIVNEELRPIERDEVLIETDYSVISAGTEKAVITQAGAELGNIGSLPAVLGYSGSGHIIEIGADVKDVKVGDKVLCDHLGHRSHVIAKKSQNGGYGYIKLPDDTDMIEAAFVVIGSMGVQGLRKCKLQMGESCMITGLGILGMFALQAAILSGASPVIAVDFDEKRLATALEYGADYAISPANPDFTEKIRDYTEGRMINCNVEVTGSAKALLQALSVAAPEGRITLTGCTRVSDINIDYYSLVHKRGVQLIGAHNFVRPTWDSREGYWTRHDDYSTILRFMKRGKMSAIPMISEIIGAEDSIAAYDRLLNEREVPLGIVIDWHK